MGKRGRNADPNHVLGHGYVFIIAARHGAAFPEAMLDFMNRGIQREHRPRSRKALQKDALDLKPDVLSVLIGVNDAGRNVPLDEFEQVYDRLLAVRSLRIRISVSYCANRSCCRRAPRRLNRPSDGKT